jgi:hypothetical protein
MNQQEIVNTIKQLHLANSILTGPALAYVEETAAELAPIMRAKGVQIAKGGSTPSSRRMFERIYLEPVCGTNHGSRQQDFAMIATWEWEIHSKWGYKPVSAKSLIEFCDSLRDAVMAL